MRYSQAYKELQQELHNRNVGYGVSGYKHAQHVIELAKHLQTKDILDYGCGQQTLQKALPFPITNYDPFIPGSDTEPEPHDLVVCSDVLEHIEPECLDDVVDHLGKLTKRLLFVDIAQRPAKKVLADGRNAHLIVKSTSWWIVQFAGCFDLRSLQSYEGGFVAAFVPLEDSVK